MFTVGTYRQHGNATLENKTKQKEQDSGMSRYEYIYRYRARARGGGVGESPRYQASETVMGRVHSSSSSISNGPVRMCMGVRRAFGPQ